MVLIGKLTLVVSPEILQFIIILCLFCKEIGHQLLGIGYCRIN
jgi:hypothetical protein